MRQLVYGAHRVGKQYVKPVWQRYLPNNRVKRCKSLSSASTPAFDTAFRNVLLPAFVYPTSATSGVAFFSRRSRLRERCFSSLLQLLPQLEYAPAYAPPVYFQLLFARAARAYAAAQPAKRRALPVRRVRLYFICASSTCNAPSRLTARCANMSSISAVRSITLTPSAAFQGSSAGFPSARRRI